MTLLSSRLLLLEIIKFSSMWGISGSPDEPPVYVGTDGAKKKCIIDQNGDNVFAAVKFVLMKNLSNIKRKLVS